MPPYSAPTLTVLRIKVRRDLRDPGGSVFSDDPTIDDFINEAIVELNRAKPLDTVLVITDSDFTLSLVGLNIEDVWAVEAVGPNRESQYIPPNNTGIDWRNGWEFMGGSLVLSGMWLNRMERTILNNQYELRVYGYRGRDPLTVGANVAEFDFEDEFLVRRYARMAGYRTLASDRALFQQWQQQANNSDVSQTQMVGTLANAEQEWGRLRKRVTKLRRPPVGAS